MDETFKCVDSLNQKIRFFKSHDRMILTCYNPKMWMGIRW